MSRKDAGPRDLSTVKSKYLQTKLPTSARSATSLKRSPGGEGDLSNLNSARNTKFTKQLQTLKKHEAMIRDLENGWRPKQGRNIVGSDTKFASPIKVDEELESLASNVHDQALKDIDVHLQRLKNRIFSNKELLDLTLKGIQSLSFSDDRHRARNILKTNDSKDLLNMNPDDILNGNDSKQWDQRLEEVSKEIDCVRKQLRSDSFETNVSTGIHQFHQVLTNTLDTISKMSNKTQKEASSMNSEHLQDLTADNDDSLDKKFYEVKARLEALERHQVPERDT